MAEVEINIITREDGSAKVRDLGKEFDKSGINAEKSAKKTTGAWNKTKKAMSSVAGGAVDFAKKVVLLTSKMASLATPIITATLASRKLAEEMGKSKKNIEDNISVWSKFKKSLSNATDNVKDKIKGFIKSVFSLKGAIATLAGTAGIGALVKSFIGAASRVEDFKTRLISLTKSEELAAQKLKQLSDFASKAPFQLPEIIEAGITVEAFGAKVKKVIRPVGDLAAFMGTNIVEASRAFGRAFAAGAGAADILRERGVLAMVKLKAGVKDLSKLTLPEFRKVLLETMTDPGGKIFGATKRLSKTFSGQMSMMSDAVFNLKKTIGNALMPAIYKLITKRITPLIKKLQEWAERNKEIIEQKFDEIITNTVNALENLIDITKRAVRGMHEWWEENKNLIIILGELYIATKAAGVIIAVMIKVAVAAKILAFAKAIGILAASTKLLTVAVWLLRPAVLAVSAAVALLVGYKIGAWLSDWISGMDKVKKDIKDLEDDTARLQKMNSVKLPVLGFADMDKFKEAIDKGIIKYDKVAKTWEKVKESVNKSLNSIATNAENVSNKINQTWSEMGENIKTAFKNLDIFPQAQFDSQVKNAIDSFKLIVDEQKLTDDQMIDLRGRLFAKLKEIGEKAADDGFIVNKEQVENTKAFFDEITSAANVPVDALVRMSKQVTAEGETAIVEIGKSSINASRFISQTYSDSFTFLEKMGLNVTETISSQYDTMLNETYDAHVRHAERIGKLNNDMTESVKGNLKLQTKAWDDYFGSLVRKASEAFDRIKADAATIIVPPLQSQGGSSLYLSGKGFGEEDVYDRGTPFVRRTGPAFLHRGEAVIPADQNPDNPANNDNRQDNRQFNFSFTGQQPLSEFDIQNSVYRAMKKAQRLEL